MSAEQIKALFAAGKTMTQESFASLVDFLQEQKGPKGDKGEPGAKGTPGAKGADGKSIIDITLSTNEDGKVIGGRATLSDQSVIEITVLPEVL